MNLQTFQAPSASAASFGAMQPFGADSGIESVVLRPLRTHKDIESILHLRDKIDLSAHTGAGSDLRALENFRSLEKKRDELGIVCAFELDGDLIGTIRIVPMGHRLTLTETLLEQMGDEAPPVSAAKWEVGRLVLAPEHRSDVEALRRCLSLAINYACEEAHIAHLYATCTHVLSRLYRRFAFSVFARDVPLLGTEKAYTLIRGTGAEVAAALGGTQAARQAQC